MSSLMHGPSSRRKIHVLEDEHPFIRDTTLPPISQHRAWFNSHQHITMSFLRQITRRSVIATRSVRTAPRAFSAYPAIGAQNGYGDPKGDPKGANPQEQGRNPEVDKEHPGPAPPSAATGSSGSSGSEGAPKAKNGAKPAIHSESQPDESSPDVKKHNEELAQRNEKTHEKNDGEKVDPKFWKGECGGIVS